MTYTEIKTLVEMIKREEQKRIDTTIELDIDYIEHSEVSSKLAETEIEKKKLEKNIASEKLNSIIDDLLELIDKY